MQYCTQCGHANPDDARFCASCGAALRTVPDVTSTMSLHGLESLGVTDTGGGVPDVRAEPEAVSGPDQAAIESLPPGSALLLVLRGPNAGSRFLLDRDVTTVGRHPDSEIFLDDVTVSRRHAEFVATGAGFAVRDVGSLNGTYVDRRRIDRMLELVDGDEVQIGKYRMVFYGTPHPRGDPSPPAQA
ncbi:MAG: FHA domain-containing protein, partial [Actinomycetes bacterium]